MDTVFRYIPYKQIDKEAWDNCIRAASNGLVYAYSWYLDTMAGEWDALVIGNYEMVFPLTWRKKYGIYYLYQPAFTPQLGLFGNDITRKHVERALLAIPFKFRLVEISLNEGNQMLNDMPANTTEGINDPSELPGSWKIISRQNYILPLGTTYDQLSAGFRQKNIIRFTRKARDFGCTYTNTVTLEQVVELAMGLMKQRTNLTDRDFDRFRELYRRFSTAGHAQIRGVVSDKGEVLASAVFFFFGNRAYYILAGNHPNGKTLGASHLLLASFIQEHAAEAIMLDFEGSSLPGLAFFYESFGSTLKLFPAVRLNRLPWWIRLIRKG